MESFGQYLRSHREKKGIRLEEISSITKIHLHSLQHIEKDEFDDLPPEPFIRGFILAYAKYVGLDTKEVLERYLAQVGPAPIQEIITPEMNGERELLPPKQEEPSHPARATQVFSKAKANAKKARALPTEVVAKIKTIPSREIFMGLGAFFVLLVIGSVIYLGKRVSSDNPTQANVTGVPAEVAVAPATPPSSVSVPEASKNNDIAQKKPEPVGNLINRTVATGSTEPKEGTATGPVAGTTAPPAAPSENKHELVITGKYRSWIKVVVDEAPPIEYFLKEGEKASYSAKNKIKVVLGNSAGAQVFHNGELVSGTKFQGTIRFYIFPGNSRFPQDVPVKRAVTSEPAPLDDIDLGGDKNTGNEE